MKERILLILCSLNLVFSRSEVLKCGEEYINNCVTCDTGANSDTCSTCEPKHFQFFNNLFCLPCDDEIYGQVGCGGNCNGERYNETGFAFCEKNGCKEGYYNLNGICFSCLDGSPGCAKCTVEKKGENDTEIYKCEKCINNEYKLSDEFGTCDHCYMDHCLKCHFTEDYTKTECDKCIRNYFLNSEKKCQPCEYVSIPNGKCLVCSEKIDDYNSGPCWCLRYSTKKNHSTCVNCPDHCPYCKYNNETNQTECQRCQSGYALNHQKTCTYCGDNCEYCFLGEDLKPICSFCSLINYLTEDKKCLPCSDNCKRCMLDKNNKVKCLECDSNNILLSNGECKYCPSNCNTCYEKENNEVGCLDCYYNSVLNSSGQCIYCSSISEIGGYGCQRCDYNIQSQKYQCLECRKEYDNINYKYIDIYAYINNTFQCLKNTDPNQKYLYGCLNAIYIKDDIYECYICKSGFIPIVNKKICKKPEEMNLSNCYEAEDIGDEINSKYICIKCYSNYAKITNIIQNITKCYYKSNRLIYCQKGIRDENNTFLCKECVDNSHLNESGICQCDSDSFGKNNIYCYKCDNSTYGNPGCEASEGCVYYHSNDKLDCNRCKSDYFSYTEGQCFSCSNEINNCNKCHHDKENEKLICDSCKDEILHYILNKEENKCELNNCEEYPEIMPGCIICDDKIEEYKSKNKCQSCKLGYFKTKDDSCIYCRSDKYGGPFCFECGYEKFENFSETKNIKCIYCPSPYYVLSSEGKCYYCRINLSFGCTECMFKKNDLNNNEKLICVKCFPGYYLNSDGNCISYLSYLKIIPYCLEYKFQIDNSFFTYYKDDEHIYYYYYRNLYNGTKEIYSEIDTYCDQCEEGYFKNNEGKCIPLTPEDCSLISIIENFPQKYWECRYFCDETKNSYVDLTFINNTNNNNENGNELGNNTIKINMNNFFSRYSSMSNDIFSSFDDDLKSLILKSQLCISNSGKGGEKAPENLRKCSRCEYNDSYVCTECIDGYILDNETNLCKQDMKMEGTDKCYIENIGTELNPIYSCKKCYNKNNILVTMENGVKFCMEPYGELQSCIEVTADTTYINNKYNCTSCTFNYISYYSKFFDKKICQNIYTKITKEKEISLENFKLEENTTAIDGKCEKNNLFTPDGINCYSCNNENVGMPGCKGSCSFSLKRNNVLKCEEECKEEYIETSEGICEPCSSVNKGCYECHYENEYPIGYLGVKRKRRFVCDYCEDGYIKSEYGKCLHCSDLGFSNCEECSIDPENKEFICTKCNEGFFLNENGYCSSCGYLQILGNNNKCTYCDTIDEGGIKGCGICERIDNKIKCQTCKVGYILLTNNNTCLEKFKNKELEKFEFCAQLTLKNNQLYCSKCKIEYTLLKNNNNEECIYNPLLFDIFYIDDFYNYYYYYHYSYDDYYYYYYYYFIYDFYIYFYYYKDYDNFYAYNDLFGIYYPCQESINLGTEDNPIYSCTKCYQILEKDNFNKFTRIINEKNNVSICIIPYRQELDNCTEALNKTKNGIIKYDCIKCFYDNELIYNSETNMHYCQYIGHHNKCMVKYCKTCKSNDKYFCSICLNSDYAVNSLTGACVKKTEIVPSITWKDIFRLQLNSVKTINNRNIYGPSLRLRGITNSQINSRHSFLIYLTFKIKVSTRNLAEEAIPAICEILNEVEETSNDTNIVDYECIGNASSINNLEDYELNNIEEGDNNGNIKKNNLDEIVHQTDLKNLVNKTNSNFTIDNLMQLITFEMDEVKNQTSANYKYDFKINGHINKDLEPINIDRKFKLSEVESEADCKFVVKENNEANFNCKINLEKYKDIKTFSFKTSEIITDDNKNIYLNKLNEVTLINEGKINKDKLVIIAVSVSGVILIGIIIAIIIIIRQRRSENNEKLSNEKNKNIINSKNRKDEIDKSNDFILKAVKN